MIFRFFPTVPAPDTVETPLSIKHRLEYYAACLILDEAYIRFGPEKAKAVAS